jgi:hypothetical protein
MLEQISAWICGRHQHGRKSLDASWWIRRARSTDPRWSSKRRGGAPDAAPHGHQNPGKQGAGDRGSDRTGRFLTPRLAHVFLASDRRWYRASPSRLRASAKPGNSVTGLRPAAARALPAARSPRQRTTVPVASVVFAPVPADGAGLKRLSGGGYNILRLRSHSSGSRTIWEEAAVLALPLISVVYSRL